MSDTPSLSHLSESDQPRMVDVSQKAITARTAVATCLVNLGAELVAQMEDGELKNKKGPVMHTAILAGIQGTKLTSQLIPLCHPLPLDSSQVEINISDRETVQITCTARTTGKTGVEMEALTGASVAALTLYDMCKSANPGIVISQLKLVQKTGGKSDFSAS
ncbi:cyclic pyranopterin monophosphate synthase MoaC [Roseibacillus ishigakijimensis]|uniref:cyclic pyranopterin monophosphate synthase n=1 Tax=Roseibacillus ishigakijimensis TaxID=454146 RepID=A0A934RKX1_9BACT|nr:cyclic pyranopterin monophosphate synthase MoaC [Roseibacillus ishigakijimensis]MBK1833602.1 cyclic pyranopterin monophosphate synthase MoaC [Roseibacillus ishigakijimensis]